MNRIPHLEELIQNYVSEDLPENVIDYSLKDGTSVGQGIWHDNRFAAQINFMSAGTTFTEHTHDEHETIVVVQGRMHVFRGEHLTTVEKGEAITFLPGVAHKVRVKEDTMIVAITVPGSAGYPDGPS